MKEWICTRCCLRIRRILFDHQFSTPLCSANKKTSSFKRADCRNELTLSRQFIATLHRYVTVYLPSGSCHSDVTSLPPPLPLPLISRLDARTGSAVPNCVAARTRCAAHFFSFLRSCGDVTFLCVGPPYERNIRRYHVKTTVLERASHKFKRSTARRTRAFLVKLPCVYRG